MNKNDIPISKVDLPQSALNKPDEAVSPISIIDLPLSTLDKPNETTMPEKVDSTQNAETPSDFHSSLHSPDVNIPKQTDNATQAPASAIIGLTAINDIQGEIFSGESCNMESMKSKVLQSEIGFSDVWYNGKRGVLLSKDLSDNIGIFVGEDLITDLLTVDCVFYLPKPFSDKLRLFNTEDWVRVTDNGYSINNRIIIDQMGIKGIPDVGRAILFDDENSLAAVLRFEYNKMTFDTAVKLPSNIVISDYNLELAYDNYAVLSSKTNHDIAIFNTNNFTVIKSIPMHDWETLCGYYDKLYLSQNVQERTHCLYQINRKTNVVRVYDYNNEKVLRQYNLNQIPTKTQLRDIFSDREGKVFFLFENDNHSERSIYYFDLSKNTLLQLKFGERQMENIFMSFSNIDNMFFYYTWEDEYNHYTSIAGIYDEQGEINKMLLVIDYGNNDLESTDFRPVNINLEEFIIR